MNAPIDEDKAFEEYLQRGSAVSQRYRALDADDVPSELDRQILQHAAQAVRPSGNRVRTLRRWSVPVALAASTVLVVSIVLESGVMTESETPMAQTAREPSAPSSAPAPAAQESAREQKPIEVFVATDPVLDFAPAAPPEPAGASGASVQEQPAVRATRASRIEEERKQVAGPRREQAADRADPPAAFVQASPPAPAAAPYEPDRSGERAERRSAPLSAISASQAPVAQRQVAPLPDLNRMDKAESAEADLTSSAASRDASELERPDPAEPEPWLEYIRALRDEGKIEQADAEWQRFRDAYPDYAVEENDLARPQE